MTRDLAQQWTGRKGIRVNALAPGFFKSEMTDEYPEGTSTRRPTDDRRANGRSGRAGRDRDLVGIGRRRIRHRANDRRRRRSDRHA